MFNLKLETMNRVIKVETVCNRLALEPMYRVITVETVCNRLSLAGTNS